MKITYHELLDKPGVDAATYVEADDQSALKARVNAKLASRRSKWYKLRTVCAAAAAILLLTITVAAGFSGGDSTELTAELLRKGRPNGTAAHYGYEVFVSEDAYEVIDEHAINYELLSVDKYATFYLHSVMGHHSEYGSQLIFTLSLDPAEGVTLPTDEEALHNICFSVRLVPADGKPQYSSCGMQTNVPNEDGGLEIMVWMFVDGDVTNGDYTLHIGDAIGANDEFVFLGDWEFALDDLALTDVRMITVDPALKVENGVKPVEVGISPFGGYIIVDEDFWDVYNAEVLAFIQENYPHLGVTALDLDSRTDSLYDMFLAGRMTLEEFSAINSFRFGIKSPLLREIGLVERYGAHIHIQADPTGFGVHPLEDGLYMLQFTFPEPQNIDEALGLRIDNVLIPIS